MKWHPVSASALCYLHQPYSYISRSLHTYVEMFAACTTLCACLKLELNSSDRTKVACEGKCHFCSRQTFLADLQDRAKGDKEEATEKFKAVSEAYDVLNDPDKRKVYDQFGEEGLKNGGMPNPGAGGGMPGGFGGGMPGGFQYSSRSAEDIFADVRH